MIFDPLIIGPWTSHGHYLRDQSRFGKVETSCVTESRKSKNIIVRQIIAYNVRKLFSETKAK
jgi:hypothetical protein